MNAISGYPHIRTVTSQDTTMRASSRSRLPIRILFALLFPIVIAACAPAPIYKTSSSTVTTSPQQVAATPENFHGEQVVWGGRVVGVHNFPDHSEIEILGYPLDSSQRPRVKQPAGGRFIAIVPGYVEPMDYPDGALVTLRGHIEGTRSGSVGEAAYVFPLVRSDAMHRWTAEEMRQGHPNVSIGVGVGGWIH